MQMILIHKLGAEGIGLERSGLLLFRGRKSFSFIAPVNPIIFLYFIVPLSVINNPESIKLLLANLTNHRRLVQDFDMSSKVNIGDNCTISTKKTPHFPVPLHILSYTSSLLSRLNFFQESLVFKVSPPCVHHLEISIFCRCTNITNGRIKN
jgi:hypothetical protein